MSLNITQGYLYKQQHPKLPCITKSQNKVSTMLEKDDRNDSAKEEADRYIAGFEAIITQLVHIQGLDAFEKRASDVIISSFPKSGNALLAQMCYQIAVASGGASDADRTGTQFEDVMHIAPWIENMSLLHLQPFESSPRIFKTHAPVPAYQPAVCKFIVIVRDPRVIPHSMLNFLFPVLVGDASAEARVSDDVRQRCLNGVTERLILDVPPNSSDGLGAWHAFTKACLNARSDRVLVLFYEQVVADIDGTARTVADFMECELSSEGRATVVERCDQDYMAGDVKFHGLVEQAALKLPVPALHTQRRDYVGFKKFKMSQELEERIVEMNRRAFGVDRYEDIVRMFSTKTKN